MLPRARRGIDDFLPGLSGGPEVVGSGSYLVAVAFQGLGLDACQNRFGRERAVGVLEGISFGHGPAGDVLFGRARRKPRRRRAR